MFSSSGSRGPGGTHLDNFPASGAGAADGDRRASSPRGRERDRSMTDDRGRFEVRVTSDSHFAWIRTRLSLERTLMSWLRTAVALIGFGFTIVQFLERLPKPRETG